MDEENILRGKHFSITDPKDVNTVIYRVFETEKEYLKESPKYTIQRLDHTEQFMGENKKKTFFVDDPTPGGDALVIFSFGKEKVVVNMGLLDEDKVKITKKPMPIKFKTLYSEQEQEYREFTYTPSLKRPISIIDPETTEEIKPVLYFDDDAKEIRGKCKLRPYKSYFAFEIRDDK